jgi:hypothetical protein
MRLFGSGNAAALAMAQRQAAESQENGLAVSQVAKALGRARTVEQAAQVALEAIRKAFGWAYGSYWRLDAPAKVLRFAVESGEAGPEFRQVTLSASFAEGVGLSGRAWRANTATRCRCLRRFESFAVVTGAGLFLAAASETRPVPDVLGGMRHGQDEFREQAADFVAGQRDQLAVARAGTPFTDSVARVTTRNAAPAMAKVMWAYQAS